MPRTLLLTGVTRGLGRALAVRFAAEGHRLAGCGRSAADLESLGEEIGEEHLLRRVDVTDAAAVGTWAEEVLGSLGPPDLLVNNAGVINRPAPLWQVPAGEWSRVVNVNVKGVVHVLRSFLPAMIERGRGVVANFSSGWGRFTSPNVAPYCATKWAIEGLTGSLGQELPDGMAAVAVSPGIVQTEMLETVRGEVRGTVERPEEWVERAAPYLLGLGPADNGKQASVPAR